MARGSRRPTLASCLVVLAFCASAWAGEPFGQAVADRVRLALHLQDLPFLSPRSLDRVHGEVEALVRKVAPPDLPQARRSAVLNAIEPFIAEHFPRGTPDQAYVEFRDQLGTLKWALWLALTRKDLTPEQLAKREEQRLWMRDWILSLPDHPEFGTQAEELAKLERFFADPLLPPFQEPMTAEQFAAFRKYVERRKPRHVGHAAGNLRFRAFITVYPARVIRETQLPFADRARGFALSSGGWHMELESNAMQRPRRHQLEALEVRKSALFDLTGMRVLTCRAGPGEANFRKWLADSDDGDLAYDGQAKALIALRGAKLALLGGGTWYEADRLTDAQLGQRLAQHGADRVPLSAFRFRDPALGPRWPIAFVAAQKPGGSIDVLRLIRWTHRDCLGIETRPRPSSLARQQPGHEEPPPPAARLEPWTPPERNYGKVESFEALSVGITPHYPGEGRKVQIDIQPDGSVTYSLKGTLARREINHAANFRLTLERLRELEGLLKATSWLTKPGADKTVHHTHPTEYTMTLRRQGKTNRLNCYDTREEPYWRLFRFLHRIDRQERLLWKLTGDDGDARHHAARDLGGELRAFLGYPVGDPVYPAVDYWRFVPVMTKWVAEPEGMHEDELATAVRLLAHLRVESQWDAIVALARRRGQPIQEATADALAEFGSERAARELGRLVPTSHAARWALIRLGPVAAPTIARLLETPAPQEGRDPAYPLVRAFIDRWSEVPGPLDPRVAAAARKCLEARRWQGHQLEYFQQFVRLIETAPPPAGRVLGRITPKRLQDKQLPYDYGWRVFRGEPVRLIHGWYTVVDGKVAEHAGGGVERQAATGNLYLGLKVALEQGALVLEITRLAQGPHGLPHTATVTGRTTAPDEARLTHVRRLDQPAPLTDRLTTVWRADLVREGQVLKTVVYAARAVPQDDPATAFEPPRQPPRRVEDKP